jgi:hypothetical protein
LYIKPELAYGAVPRPQIPPNSLLQFDVELVSVKPPPPVAPPHGASPPAAPASSPPGTDPQH